MCAICDKFHGKARKGALAMLGGHNIDKYQIWLIYDEDGVPYGVTEEFWKEAKKLNIFKNKEELKKFIFDRVKYEVDEETENLICEVYSKLFG